MNFIFDYSLKYEDLHIWLKISYLFNYILYQHKCGLFLLWYRLKPYFVSKVNLFLEEHIH